MRVAGVTRARAHVLRVWSPHAPTPRPSPPADQCRSLLREPIAVNAGQRIVGTLHCKANARFSYDMSLTMQLHGSELTTANGHAIESFNEISLADQQYSYLTTSYA